MRSRRSFIKISLRSKIIIFCVLSVIVVIIAVNVAVTNRRSNQAKTNNVAVSENNKLVKRSKNQQKSTKDNKLEIEYKKAEGLFRQKQYSNSIKQADEIIRNNPKFYKAYNIKGIALCYSGDYENGMKNIDYALEISPEYGYARFNKALAYELYGKYDEALAWYDKDLEIEKYVWSYYGKASIYGRRGDVENTVKYLKEALHMSPEIKSIAKEEKDFDPVKNSSEFKKLIE